MVDSRAPSIPKHDMKNENHNCREDSCSRKLCLAFQSMSKLPVTNKSWGWQDGSVGLKISSAFVLQDPSDRIKELFASSRPDFHLHSMNTHTQNNFQKVIKKLKKKSYRKILKSHKNSILCLPGQTALSVCHLPCFIDISTFPYSYLCYSIRNDNKVKGLKNEHKTFCVMQADFNQMQSSDAECISTI